MKHLLFKLQSFLVLLVFTAASAYAQKSPVDMNRFIDDLMKKMTLEEKIGQLNLPVTGEITTGQAKSSNVAKRIRAGEVGGLFNLKGVERIRDVQKQAVEESRLGIPLLCDVIVCHYFDGTEQNYDFGCRYGQDRRNCYRCFCSCERAGE